MKKILAVDLDGTLTNSRKEITPRTREALRKMQEAGHILALATGRPLPGVMPVVRTLDMEKSGGYAIACNGGVLIDCKTGEHIYEKTLPRELVAEIFAFAEELGIGIYTYAEQGIVAGSRHDDHMEYAAAINHLKIFHPEHPMELVTGPVTKCMATVPEHRGLEIAEKLLERFGDRVTVLRSELFFVEMVPADTDKAKGIASLLERLGVAREDVIACGDGLNDIAMLKYAGLGVAMANAQESVKAVADVVALSNDEDGVARVIEEYML